MSKILAKEQETLPIDFENVEVSENEQKMYDSIEELLAESDAALKAIEEYTGCQELARKAMTTPSHENEQEAFEGLLGAVDAIDSFYKFSIRLAEMFPDLMVEIAKASGMFSDTEGEAVPAALCTQLARIMDFSLRFDQTRMLRPNLSNDFSYYRRLLPKFNKHPNIRIKDDEASGMALFTAEHIPMMSCLSQAGRNAQDMNRDCTRLLSVMANSCMKLLKQKKCSEESTLLCVRAMTGCIVLFDHVDDLGAFHKKSPINIKGAIILLKKDFPKDLSLQNAIHYSTANFKDAPQNIQDLFD